MQHRIAAALLLVIGTLILAAPASAQDCAPSQRDDRYPQLESKCLAPAAGSHRRASRPRAAVDANFNAASPSPNLLRAYAGVATTGRSAFAKATADRDCLTSDTRAVLEQAERHFGVRFALAATCRPGATIAGSDKPSWHRYGRAFDVLVPRGISKSAAVRFFYRHARGVTMTYRNMAHVHVDTGRYHRLVRGADAFGGRRQARRPHQRHARR